MTDFLTPFNEDSLPLNLISGGNSSPANPIGSNGSTLATSQMDTNKDRRPDLLQYKQLLGTLDPAGIPLLSATLPGNAADDPVYWPAWQEMAQVIGHKDFVVVADNKAAAIATRARISDSGGIRLFSPTDERPKSSLVTTMGA